MSFARVANFDRILTDILSLQSDLAQLERERDALREALKQIEGSAIHYRSTDAGYQPSATGSALAVLNDIALFARAALEAKP